MTSGFNLYVHPLQIESTIHPATTFEMPRNNRVRRAPNREPTSLAAPTTVLGSIEALDIDLALSNSPLISRPSTPQSGHSTPPALPTAPPISNEYPIIDADLDIGYIYPNTLPPPQGQEVS